MLTLKSALNLEEKHAEHPKTPRAVFQVQNAYLGLKESGLKEALGNEQRLVDVVAQEMSETLKCSENATENFTNAEKRL